ncbi:MAG: hypothetical protein J5I93_16950 [Pirellulaceae bacterium]|nr:hypothetical protein [Pirellulaceae bacterium]
MTVKHPSTPLALAAALIAGLWWNGLPVRADLRDGFETPEAVWRLADTDCAFLTARRRTFEQAHGGQGCELLQLSCGPGSTAYLAYDLGHARVIDELLAELWVKSNRTGLQMMLRVVLPHSLNPHDGRPLSVLLPGTTYNTPGAWQRLAVDNPARKLQSRLPSLRSQFGSQVTPREAYADLVVVNAYAGPGVVQVCLDDLAVHRMVSDPVVSVAFRGESAADAGTPESMAGPQPAGSRQPGPRQATLLGESLLAGGRLVFPRMVDHRGEPFELLKALGFNTVRLPAAPTASQLESARQLKLWLVCPPPPVPPGQTLDETCGPVLAWNLGDGLGSGDLAAAEARAGQWRRADLAAARPLVCSTAGPLHAYSRVADTLLLQRDLWGGGFPLTDWTRWLESQRRGCRLGTPTWATIPTQHAAEIGRQVAAFAPQADGIPLVVEPEQLRTAAFAAIAAGVRGIHFASTTRLDANDLTTRLRAACLQRLNLELQLIEPWVAGGEWIELRRDSPAVEYGLWQTERSRLLVVVRSAEHQQYVMAPTARTPVQIDLYGVPVTDQAFRITADGLRGVRQRRGSSTHLELADAPRVSLIVMTENPLVLQYLTRFMSDHRQRLAQLRYEVASQWHEQTQHVQQQLSSQSRGLADDERRLSLAQSHLVQSRRLLDSQEFQHAEAAAEEALDELARLRRVHWERAVQGFEQAVASPLCVAFETLPLHWSLAHRLQVARWSDNWLAGGDLEDLGQMQRHGWSQRRQEPAGVAAAVELTREQPRQGQYVLRLRALPLEQSIAPPAEPPIVIESAPVPVPPGSLVQLKVWVRISTPPPAGSGGLQIWDSAGGRSLALTIDQTDGWQPFALYRAIPPDQRQLTVRFALAGFGEVLLDDVSVRTLQPLDP